MNEACAIETHLREQILDSFLVMRADAIKRLVAVAIVFAGLLPSGTAQADEETGKQAKDAVGWRAEWPRVRPWEYAYAVVALGTGLTLRFVVESPPANWRGGVLFDDAIMDRLPLENLENRRFVQWYGDVLFYGSMAYRAVDSLALPLAVHSDPDLALQMSMIDLESFGTVALVLWGSQLFVRRERPQVARCGDPRFEKEIATCDPGHIDRNRSFIAGHAATVLTAAGLTCLHHAHNPLYGGAGDPIACGASLSAAGMMGLARLWNEAHYPTDLVLGYALGAFAGWFMPAALHYGFGSRTERNPLARTERRLGTGHFRATLAPLATGAGLGATIVGVF